MKYIIIQDMLDEENNPGCLGRGDTLWWDTKSLIGKHNCGNEKVLFRFQFRIACATHRSTKLMGLCTEMKPHMIRSEIVCAKSKCVVEFMNFKEKDWQDISEIYEPFVLRTW